MHIYKALLLSRTKTCRRDSVQSQDTATKRSESDFLCPVHHIGCSIRIVSVSTTAAAVISRFLSFLWASCSSFLATSLEISLDALTVNVKQHFFTMYAIVYIPLMDYLCGYIVMLYAIIQ